MIAKMRFRTTSSGSELIKNKTPNGHFVRPVSPNRFPSINDSVEDIDWKDAAIPLGDQGEIGWLRSQLYADRPIPLSTPAVTCGTVGFIAHFARVFSEPARAEGG